MQIAGLEGRLERLEGLVESSLKTRGDQTVTEKVNSVCLRLKHLDASRELLDAANRGDAWPQDAGALQEVLLARRESMMQMARQLELIERLQRHLDSDKIRGSRILVDRLLYEAARRNEEALSRFLEVYNDASAVLSRTFLDLDGRIRRLESMSNT
ncbi:hypothetical protein GUITHDRAFT_104809 [Guillardia theta CCMP2712]|uniref:Uncharacterized protein n=1 Tax=Guillardia theta (strain CCMP2712) TaxID=905079 RepID=L1JM95_GUITC|nr:hypothetical protein GUITHDRAFT_104809 [Guillardia theta CCMP2712]EKX49280.1 hypothetical protein GUITHDRAFT_104809 [Guillardia theta CCMP2712]|eukprot:XP_005836260.1 hypothetical protein GUITHDRAFT_104809 [Guillardia theta CCMP2712]